MGNKVARYAVFLNSKKSNTKGFEERDDMLLFLTTKGRAEVAAIRIDGVKQGKPIIDSLCDLSKEMFVKKTGGEEGYGKQMRRLAKSKKPYRLRALRGGK